MASPSGKEGLRCNAPHVVDVSRIIPPWKIGEVLNNPAPGGVNRVEECGGLILEQDAQEGLGVRCWKKDCRKFHPLEVLISRAVEEGLLNPKQREAIRRAVSEESERQPEEEMTTAKMKAYCLYKKGKRREYPKEIELKIDQRVVVVARSPKEAASILGGDYSELEGGIKNSVEGSEHRDELYFVGTVSFAPELFRKMDETDRALAGLYGGGVTYSKGPLHLLGGGITVKLEMYEYGVILPDYVVFLGYDT